MAIADLQPDRYLVFEADQVLTNNHLNQLFYYLDQQNRWTRNKLIGIGIACGLEIVLKPGIIEITKGCGVTSQGYLILHGPKQYTYYLPYDAVAKPEHLPFEYDVAPGLPFFKEYCDKAGPVFQLLDDDGYNDLEAAKKPQAKTISSAAAAKLLDDYVVVLFLEADEIDLKNCDAFDCNNEGERMMLQVRPLLVRKRDLPEAIAKAEAAKQKKRAVPVAAVTDVKITAPEVALRRFNVPYTLLRSTDDILNAFAKITDDATLDSIDAAYQFCYNKYKSIVKAGSNPFGGLADTLIKQRKTILAKQPWLIQYFYDFVDDLIKAYLEFRAKMNMLQSACCPDENKFPLHLVLGEATEATSSLEKNAYRTYFIYSPLFARQAAELGEIEMLFRRMVLLTEEFNLLEQQAQQAAAINQLRTNRKGDEAAIKITPSRYELAMLSQRAIPYYYEVNENGNELYKLWNFYKTIHGNAAFNLSYHSYQYSSADVVLQPLLYDIEHFDFFRIEGHIGLPYQSALNNLLKQRLNYNLPFDIVAISAERLPLTDTTELPECNIEDLDTDYKLIVSEFACKVHEPFCFITQAIYPLPNTVNTNNFSKGVGDAAAAESGNEPDFQPFTTFERKEVAPTAAILLAIISASYAKGDFLRKHCNPAEGTLGYTYLKSLNSNGVFTNPIQPGSDGLVQQLYFYAFPYVDAVESLMQVLLSSTISTLEMDKFSLRYKEYLRENYIMVLLLSRWINTNTSSNENANQRILSNLLIDSFSIAAAACIDERLQTLKEEYNRRLQQYALQRSFYYYYRKHPGLEHKAGVPKGGTFVLVYHTADRLVQNTTNAAVDTIATIARRQAATTNEAATPAADSSKADTATEARTYYEYDATYLNAFKSFVDDCNDAPPEKKTLILSLLGNLHVAQQPAARYEIPTGAVIADFYVPYLCCSDCPPVAYVLPQQPTDTTVFDIQPRTFLFDDEHNYPFTAKPPVTSAGTVQNPFPPNADLKYGDGLNLLTDEQNILYLHPAMQLEKTLQTTVAYKGISVPITIIVPDASFTLTITNDATGLPVVKLDAKLEDATTYEWFVNDKESVFESKPHPATHTLRELITATDTEQFIIALNVTYEVNKRVSSDNKKVKLTLEIIKDKIGKGPFELPYEKEDDA